MDFLDPNKKKAHQTRLFIGYALMAIALAIATFIVLFAAYGYDIDRKTGGIIQNGLIIVDAHPESAEIIINNERLGTTSDRLVLPAGSYSLQLQRDGYRNWKHQINLEGSSIEQLAYPFLFPEKLVTKAIQQYPGIPAMASISPDRHWLVVQTSSTTSGAFTNIDLNNNKNPAVSINVPTNVVTDAASHTYEAVEWSTDNIHLLMKHTYTGGHEYIMLDRNNPAESINITRLFPDQQYTSLSLRDKRADQLYLFNAPDGTLSVANTQTRAVSPLLTQVISYKSYQSDTLAYITNPGTNPTTAELHLRQNGVDHLVRTLPVSTTYLLDLAQFSGNLYLASGSQADGRVYVYKNPFDDFNRKPARTPSPFRVLVVKSAEYVSFSGIARFIAVQGGSNFAVYDIENDRQTKYDIKLTLVPHQKATWMDGHRLSLMSQGSVYIYDFDGQNIQTLSPGLTNFSPFFDRDYKAMFTLAPDPEAADKTVLLRTELKVLPNNGVQ